MKLKTNVSFPLAKEMTYPALSPYTEPGKGYCIKMPIQGCGKCTQRVGMDTGTNVLTGNIHTDSNLFNETTGGRGMRVKHPPFYVGKTKDVKNFLKNKDRACEILVSLQPFGARKSVLMPDNTTGGHIYLMHNCREKQGVRDGMMDSFSYNLPVSFGKNGNCKAMCPVV